MIVWEEVKIRGKELGSWEHLCMSLRVLDVWHSQAFIRGHRTLLFSRLDRRNAGVNLSG